MAVFCGGAESLFLELDHAATAWVGVVGSTRTTEMPSVSSSIGRMSNATQSQLRYSFIDTEHINRRHWNNWRETSNVVRVLLNFDTRIGIGLLHPIQAYKCSILS